MINDQLMQTVIKKISKLEIDGIIIGTQNDSFVHATNQRMLIKDISIISIWRLFEVVFSALFRVVIHFQVRRGSFMF